MAHIVQRRLPWSVRKQLEAKNAPPKRETPAIITRIVELAYQRPHGSRGRLKMTWGNLAHQVLANRAELNSDDLCEVLIAFAKPHVASHVPLQDVSTIVHELARAGTCRAPALAQVLHAVEVLRPHLSADLKAQLFQMIMGRCADLSFQDLMDVAVGLSKLKNRATINQDFLDELWDAITEKLETDASINPVICLRLPPAVTSLGTSRERSVLRVMENLAHIVGSIIESRLNLKLRDVLHCCDAFGGPYKDLGRKIILYCEEELRQLTDEQVIGMDRHVSELTPTGRKLVNAEFVRRGLEIG